MAVIPAGAVRAQAGAPTAICEDDMQEQDRELARRCHTLAELCRRAGGWVADNTELVGNESASLQKDLRHAARFFGKCEEAARRKMCAGVFGPSQSGKSYLISALARDASGRLLADFCGRECDFITEINPEGGKESTGLVTRFTTTPPEGLDEGYPIRLRLLTEMDVVRVLANTYYADCEHKEAPEMEPLLAALDNLAALPPDSDAGTVSRDDVEELRDYINRNFISRPRVQMLQKGYWLRAMELAPRLNLENRATLFSLIWNSVPQFHQLYLTLCGALQALGNPAEADCPLDALIPRNTSIIDVAVLQGLTGEQHGDSLTIRGAGGRTAALPRAVVAALTAEISIYMREKPDALFDYTDLLDFPGYRSRLKLENLSNELERPGTLENLFLRGKVAYLFERYCEERELTSMLLCIGPSNQEVQDLPRAVYDWICSTHGEAPQHRAGKAPSLFFILSKMDMEFEKKAGTPSVEKRWTTRLQSSLLDFFGKQHDWPVNWDGSHPFNNVYLLRNPNFRCEAIFNFDEQGHETEVRPEQRAYVEEVRQAFLQSELVRRHVARPDVVWNAAMSLNDGGVGLLRESLRPLCNPELKRQQIGVVLTEKREQVLSRLEGFYQSDDKEELRRQKELLSRQLVMMVGNVTRRHLFGELLHRLQVNDYDLYDLWLRERRAASEAPAAPVAVSVADDISVDDIFADIFGDSADRPAASASPAPEEPVQRDTAGALADMVFDYWIEQLHSVADSAEARNHFGLPAREFSQLISELLLAAQRTGVRKHLEEQLRQCGAYTNMARERLIWRQVSLAADGINAFVDWLGFDPRYHDARARTILMGGKSCEIFAPPAEPPAEPVIGEQESPYDRQWYTDWMRALAWSVMANADFDGQQTRNPEQNNRLRDILTAFRA